jgi:dienelactone hydrolase
MRKQVETALALAVFTAILFARPAASAEELVKFESAEFRFGEIQQRQARERGETPPNATDTIDGYLSKPEGNGPFPAVVYLHGCSGLSKSGRSRIAQLMTGWGYVALAVDSFATRGIKHACDYLMPARQGDALGALRYLLRLPFVDPQRIALVGSSQGAITALGLVSTRPSLFAVPDDLKFSAVVAYYPFCNVATEQLTAPTIVLIGELDDWTPAKDCEHWMERRAGKGAPVRLVIYPGTYHAFDVPTLGDGRQIFGHWLKYDADAAQRSVVEMHDFLITQFAK